MRTVETETQDERISRTAHNLAALAKEQKVRVQESKQLCVAATETLEAHSDFLCTDELAMIEQLQNRLKDEISEASESSEGDKATDEQADKVRSEIKNELYERVLDRVKNNKDNQNLVAADEQDEELKPFTKAEKCIEFNKQEIEQVIGAYIPAFQRKILEAVLAELPEKERAYQEEEARDEASNELSDLLNERPYTEQTEIYKGLLEQVRNGEVLAVA